MVRVFSKRELVLFIATLTVFISTAGFLFAGQYQVYRIVDGDTFVVKHGSIKITVKLVGIDAPEMSNRLHQVGQPFSLEAEQYLSKLIAGKTVDVKSYGADRNGRTLGEVFLPNGRNVNLEMVQAGFAEVTRAAALNIEPYWKAERAAIAGKRGMWVLEDKYVSPKEWRRLHGN